jgi:hypothetical protein
MTLKGAKAEHVDKELFSFHPSSRPSITQTDALKYVSCYFLKRFYLFVVVRGLWSPVTAYYPYRVTQTMFSSSPKQ